MGEEIFQVDAFTDRAFAGNPAAVCILKKARDDDWRQNVAKEMNLSETAFLRRGHDHFSLRWFTPVVEVEWKPDVRREGRSLSLEESEALSRNLRLFPRPDRVGSRVVARRGARPIVLQVVSTLTHKSSNV